MVDLQRAYIAFERNLLNLTLHCSRPTTSPPFPASRTTSRDPTTYIPRVRRCHPHGLATQSPVWLYPARSVTRRYPAARAAGGVPADVI
jgi:hypothetical protein